MRNATASTRPAMFLSAETSSSRSLVPTASLPTVATTGSSASRCTPSTKLWAVAKSWQKKRSLRCAASGQRVEANPATKTRRVERVTRRAEKATEKMERWAKAPDPKVERENHRVTDPKEANPKVADPKVASQMERDPEGAAKTTEN